MREFLVFQSLWAMQDHHGQCDLPLEAQLDRIVAAGFDGVTDHYWLAPQVGRLHRAAKARGLQIEGQVFPRTVDDLAAALDVGLSAAVAAAGTRPTRESGQPRPRPSAGGRRRPPSNSRSNRRSRASIGSSARRWLR